MNINKKILLSSVSAFSSLALLVGATYAFFTDNETSSGNTFTAGTLDLKVNGTDVPGTLVTLSAKPSENLEPVTVTLTNTGSNGGIADLHFTAVVDSQGVTTEPECAADAENGIWNGQDCLSPTSPQFDVSNKIGVDIGYDLDNSGAVDDDEYLIWTDSSNPFVMDAGELSWGTNTNENKVVATLAKLNSVGFDLGYLVGAGAGAGPRNLVLSFHLDSNTGNAYQGDVSTFDIEFTLHQPNVPTNNIIPSGIPTPEASPSPSASPTPSPTP